MMVSYMENHPEFFGYSSHSRGTIFAALLPSAQSRTCTFESPAGSQTLQLGYKFKIYYIVQFIYQNRGLVNPGLFSDRAILLNAVDE